MQDEWRDFMSFLLPLKRKRREKSGVAVQWIDIWNGEDAVNVKCWSHHTLALEWDLIMQHNTDGTVMTQSTVLAITI